MMLSQRRDRARCRRYGGTHRRILGHLRHDGRTNIPYHLSMLAICPWCRTSLPVGPAPSACQTCDRPLLNEAGERLREIDLVYPQLVREQESKLGTFLRTGLPIAAIASIPAPFLHGTIGALSIPMFVLAHMIPLRVYLLKRPRQLLGRRRRFFTRQISRWSFLILAAVGYSLTTIPVAGIAIGAATFAGITLITYRYLMWSLQQELERKPLQLWEKLVLVFLVLLLCGILAAIVAFGLLVGWAVPKLFS